MKTISGKFINKIFYSLFTLKNHIYDIIQSDITVIYN